MGDPLTLQPASAATADALAAFIATQSARPRQRCLHAWTGQSTERLAHELRGALGTRLAYIVMRDGDDIRGVMGASWTPGQPHAWLRGPILDVPDGDWSGAAGALAERLIAACPRFSSLTAYPDVANDRLVDFYLRQGLTPGPEPSHVYALALGGNAAADDGLAALGPDTVDQFGALFLALFPRLEHMVAHLRALAPREDELVRVAVEDGRVIGFVIARARPFRDAEIVAVGVDPGAPRRGTGRALLDAAARWAAARGEARLELTVLAGAAAAIALYERLGWRRIGTGIDLFASG